MDESFGIKNQVLQVFYANDPSSKKWWLLLQESNTWFINEYQEWRDN